MRAIIIQDKDAKDLLRRLELVVLRDTHARSRCLTGEGKADMHRIFHYEVVRWLQDQGADLK